MLVDSWGRRVNYLRIAVTDRCNLRCFYCMPENGIQYLPKKELLSYEEILRLVQIVSELGVNKIRITGGEPFVRRDLLSLLGKINDVQGIDSIHLTTNGVLTHQYIDDLQGVGIKSVNLSIDSLDKENFIRITRRDELDNVLTTYRALLDKGISTKINMVVMSEHNIGDIIPMVELGSSDNVEVRFIEEMPFNGEESHTVRLDWDHDKILAKIQETYPDISILKADKNSTSKRYQIKGFNGSFGIIPAYSRTFCDTCNRLRVTSQGTIKTCLYDDGVLDLKHHLRQGASDDHIKELLQAVVGKRFKNGFEAEKNRKVTAINESMSSIGG
ncbi:MAG: GTP 3',8-cyclase MoaA [Cyclobacteriaceae bacterium]